MLNWSSISGKKYNSKLKPYMWWISYNNGQMQCHYIPQENVQERIDGIRSGVVIINMHKIPKKYWTNYDILLMGSFTQDNGRNYISIIDIFNEYIQSEKLNIKITKPSEKQRIDAFTRFANSSIK